jgi:hypothetical protein
LRLDQQAQEKRKTAAMARVASSLSPGKPGPQRGIAQRTFKRTESLRTPRSAYPPNDLIVISDDSDDETSAIDYDKAATIAASARDASELAAMFDSRYADDDLADMENDRLHLFTLGQAPKKRKRQLKLTDASHKSKKPTFVDDGPRGPKVAGTSRNPRSTRTRLASTRSRVRLHTPPALSIVDVDQSSIERNGPLPQFMRLAMRRAQMRSDQGRHSPRKKHIRLHTSRDTEDANTTLERWTKGQIKVTKNSALDRGQRFPLSDRTANEQSAFPFSAFDKESLREHDIIAAQRGPLSQAQKSPNPAAISRNPHKESKTSSLAGRSAAGFVPSRKRIVGSIHRSLPVFRTGQLESLESDLGSSQRKIAFERGLQRADQQWAQLPRWQPSINPQLARFLADDDAVLPPLPSAEDIGEAGKKSLKQSVPGKRHRLIRKTVAQRVDVETREYRQPSEPTVVDLVDNTLPDDTVPDPEQLMLEGLGPFGTHYPTSFDVTPLAMGTYFHPSTFIGADELLHALDTSKADLDTYSGPYSIHYSTSVIHCGPWNDETYSRISNALESTWNGLDNHTPTEIHLGSSRSTIFRDLSAFFRSLIKYFATKLSFLDAIDRQGFATKMHRLLNSQFEQVFAAHISNAIQLDETSQNDNQCIRAIAYLLVVGFQVHNVAQHPAVEPSIRPNVEVLMTKMAKAIVQFLIRHGVPDLGRFLESNKRYRDREDGIQEKDLLVESLVICIHTMNTATIPKSTFWDIVSQELSPLSKRSYEVKRLESIWATAFTLLPFMEFDVSGILVGRHILSSGHENWSFIRDLLKRLFALYPDSRKVHDSSVNEYIRANLSRCHFLMEKWQWRRSEPVLGAMFDFFAKNNQMQQLQREENRGSPRFLGHLVEQPILTLDPSDRSFQIFLKSLALGLRGMRNIYDEKKIRGVVIRITPNHGRSYPKDKPLDRENLDALRNHHDLLCTLYWASPPACRPKLALIQGLVQHESSHREACRLNVRAWANLTLFQFSGDEPYSSLQPFAEWHKEIMQQTLKQYRMAKTEAEDYFKAVQADGTSDISTHMVRTTIDKNQEQVIATLRDCVAGIHNAVKNNATHDFMKDFLMDSGIVQLLELPHLDDARLSVVIRDTLAVFKQYGTHQKQYSSESVNQHTSEESQDYGDFPDLDDLEDFGQQPTKASAVDFLQTPLWHLLSNAFGAERTPDDNLLMECIDIWILVASCQVSKRVRSWSYYIDSYSQVSWHQLRDTEQTRKFRSYFMANLAECDTFAYEEHRHEFFSALLTTLVDRESLLRFQHRLLQAIVQADVEHPLLKNLPFFRKSRTADLDISADTLRTRRLALISSLLANMRDDVHITMLEDFSLGAERRREYAELLRSFMAAMKNNYLQLCQGATVTGAYVEFVQKIVQFLKQYTSDICPVSTFFTDNVAFPLPATDPTYVVGRLCGYAPKLSSPGVTKQLSVFIQTVAQQAASDNQQQYLIGQLSTALSYNNDQSSNRSALQGVLMQGIFPAYIEAAITSLAGLVIAKPILRCLTTVFEAMYFDIRVADAAGVETICSNIWSVCYAFIKSTGAIKDSPSLLKQPRILQSMTLILESMVPLLPILDYLGGRTSSGTRKPATIAYISEFSVFAAEVIHDMLPHSIPTFDIADTPNLHADLQSSCIKDLSDSITKNWTISQDRVYFGHGHARKEAVSELGTIKEEKAKLVRAIENFHNAVARIYDNGDASKQELSFFVGDVVI